MSQKSSGYEKIAGDRYFTPHWVTEALLSVESFTGPTCDPAAGAGHMVDAMRAAGVSCDGFDIEPEPVEDGAVAPIAQDFLTWNGHGFFDRPYVNFISNPPYGTGGRLAVEFIKHACALAAPYGGKVAMLLRVDFDSANGRRSIFGDHPAFAAKYVLTRRIRWANLEQSKSGPSVNHAWFLFDWQKRPDAEPIIGYLPKVEVTA